ncbi:hypothetical protein ABN763_12350 [Spongiivirga sp. MCCC 1A20706]|uniref:hypothetical protein n=1 Tax=Spongiivirga sp. MCCC 1A20706 TaxID=3160963 RepID=UPI0039773744
MRVDDNINELFDNLKDDFDIESPKEGHQNRFLDKLKSLDQHDLAEEEEVKVRKLSWKKPFLIAASFIVLFGLYFGLQNKPAQNDLAEVSPEMQQTEVYFTSLINEELEKIAGSVDESTQQIFEDAKEQLKLLESDYSLLTQDIIDNGADKRIISAMIINLKNRIELLENVLERIEAVKNLNNLENENTII